MTKSSASTCSPHPSPSTHGDDAPVESIAEEVLEEPVQCLETVIENTQEQPELEGIELIREFDSEVHVVVDPTLRIPIEKFHPDIRSEVRRAYLLKGPTQPKITFPRKQYGSDRRYFRAEWYANYDWLEYSVSKDAAYCFYCFLFRQEVDHEKFGHVVFSKTGYDNWKHAYRAFPTHVGGVSGCHNKARRCADDFKNQRASISHKVDTVSNESEKLYEIRLTASLDIARYLISQGHAFRGHDESPSSLNKGNFLELFDWYKQRSEEVRVAFGELCPDNARMTSHRIQKELCNSCAQQISKEIKQEIGHNLFSILIDESRDISIAEQMAVIVR